MFIDEIDAALRKVESSVTGDGRTYEFMSPATRDAICFPIRLLQLASTQGNLTFRRFESWRKWQVRQKGS
jgi:hypothetical protein